VLVAPSSLSEAGLTLPWMAVYTAPRRMVCDVKKHGAVNPTDDRNPALNSSTYSIPIPPPLHLVLLPSLTTSPLQCLTCPKNKRPGLLRPLAPPAGSRFQPRIPRSSRFARAIHTNGLFIPTDRWHLGILCRSIPNVEVEGGAFQDAEWRTRVSL
jgi:hypothetical protein